MRLALWTPTPAGAWQSALAGELARRSELAVVGDGERRATAELDFYELADTEAHGFVYRALLRRPGVVLLAGWSLHRLVHAETAGRGDRTGYLREARHAHGDIGVFVARQALAGLGGALVPRLALNQRVLETSLALVAFNPALAERAARLVAGRRVLALPLDRLERTPQDAASCADALVALAHELAPAAEPMRQAIAARAADERSPRALALDELAWVARELGLPAPPAEAARLVSELFGGRP